MVVAGKGYDFCLTLHRHLDLSIRNIRMMFCRVKFVLPELLEMSTQLW